MSPVRRFLPCRAPCVHAPAPHRLHHAERAGQSRHTKPHQTPHARSRPAGTGITEFRVVDRFQSPAQSRSTACFTELQAEVQRLFMRCGNARHQVGLIVASSSLGYKRLISPLLPSACRYYPTCSEYMREAIEIHGPAQGVWLGLETSRPLPSVSRRRIDPVPRGHARLDKTEQNEFSHTSQTRKRAKRCRTKCEWLSPSSSWA